MSSSPNPIQTLRNEGTALWNELRASTARRRATVVVLLAATLWFGVHALHDSLWAYRYWKVDPWALESPVQWPVVGRHAQALGHLPAELPCLRAGDRVAVQGPPEWLGQEHYVFMWLAFSLPEQDVIPVVEPQDLDQADLLLSFFADGPTPSPPPGWVEACKTDRAIVFHRHEGSGGSRP